MATLDWRRLAVRSLTQPRVAASVVLAYPIAPRHAAAVALVAIILGTLLASLASLVSQLEMNAASAALLSAPIFAVAVQCGFLLMTAVALAAVGRWCGGTGDLAGAIKLLTWLQVMMAGFQAVQVVGLLLVPVLAALANIAAVMWFLWALASFTAELHGFRSVPKTALMIFLSLTAVLFVVATLLTLLGVSVPQMN